MNRTLFVVSAVAAASRRCDGVEPRRDFQVLAWRLDADVLDRRAIGCSAFARVLARIFGEPVAQAWLAFRERRTYDVIVTDGEHVGIPLAMLLKLARAGLRHVTIGHRPSSLKKRPFFRWLGVQSHMHRTVVHASRQLELAIQSLGVPARQLVLAPYQVDVAFWAPRIGATERRQVASAGLEFRDYPTLFRAAAGLNAQVVIGAASHWSRRSNTAREATPPPNVRVGAFDYRELRDLYAESAVVVVPLMKVDFQAGITTILEAMAMGKPIVVTHTDGQTDVVIDRRGARRHGGPRAPAQSLIRVLAAEAGVELEPNGFYVPSGDAAALRNALEYLLDHPDERRRLGAAGRRAAERLFSVEQFAERLGRIVDEVRAEERVAAADAHPFVPTRHDCADPRKLNP